MAVPCLLRAVLQNDHHGQQKRHVKPHEPEQGSEDPVEEAVGEIAKRPHAVDFLGGHKGARADAVRREGIVEIATALEFLLDQALGAWRLLCERRAEIRAGLEGGEPNADAEEERDVGGGDNHPSGYFKPDAVGGEGGAGQGDEEGEEDQDGVDDYTCGVG